MKIIFLNTWGGRVGDALAEFMRAQSHDTDVFCFQEAYDPMKQLARRTIPDYTEIAKYKSVNEDDNFPQATYIRKGLPLISFEAMMEREPGVGLGLYTQIQKGKEVLHLCNFHGMSRPIDKLDDPGRLRQSQGIIDFLKNKQGPKIIGGDFNLFPETKSVEMFRENGYRDLVKEFGITTTRNQLAWEKYPNNKQLYSDYVFLSPDIKLEHFSVPDLAVSDHLPLILEIK